MHKPQPAARHAQRAQQHWKTGVAHGKAQRWPAAVCEFARATTLAPLESIYWLNLARAHARLEQYAAAADAARKSFDLDRSCVLAARLLAECMVKQYRYAEAVTCFEQLDPAAPRDHDLLAAHGVALLHSDRLRDAIAVFFRALALKIDNPLVHYHMGLAFKDLNMKVEAAECFRTAVTLDDGGVRILALALLVQESRQACQWEQLADDTRALRQAASTLHDAAGGGLLSPFAFLAVDCTPAEQLSVGRWRATVLGDAVPRLPALPKQRAPGRIRLGYLSSDFYNHATAMLMAELLERRDASRFEVFLYSHSRDDGSALRARVMAACDHFVDVTNLGNAATSERIRADGIDIIVDLKGHTRDSRFELLAARPAPVQGRLRRLRDRRRGGHAARARRALQRKDRADAVLVPAQRPAARAARVAGARGLRLARRRTGAVLLQPVVQAVAPGARRVGARHAQRSRRDSVDAGVEPAGRGQLAA
ncbi:MAG: hypothetical protein E6H65_10990 [Betaproteobacteria bacterium]|nr:MAG: hypothetical protein E6H65_10990 [Betaproteobacteria bacterium]